MISIDQHGEELPPGLDDTPISIDWRGKTCLVTAKPCAATYRSIVTAGRVLARHKTKAIVLRWCDGDKWRDELIFKIDAVLNRILHLTVHAERPDDRYLSCERPLGDLNKNHPWSPLVDLWRAYSDTIELGAHGDAIRQCTSDKYMIVRQDGERPTFVNFGSNWIVYKSPRWIRKCVGQPIEHQPDVSYGRWVERSFRNRVVEPILMDADVIVADPTEDDVKRITYQRLMLPLRRKDGSTEILSASYRDSSIDLRSAPVVEKVFDV